jgi:hypothetical protein
MADYAPPVQNDKITRTMSATVVGGRMIDVTGAHAAADSTSFDGIASRDAIAGQAIAVHHGPYDYGIASAAIAKGNPIKCAAAGKFVTWVPGTDTGP